MAEKKLFLLDAMALIYRAFYALNKNPRINSKGLNTSAILGFANTLFDLLKSQKPTHIGVSFDTAAPTQRHTDFTGYKANRENAPEDLISSIPYIKELIEAFRIPILEVEGYEADDVIGTLAKKAEKEGFVTYMMTPDKDFGQLVSENIWIYKPAKFGNPAEILGVKEVCEKNNIKRPEQVIDLLGLWGDASDNIPGIPGIGEVTAKKLIGDFDNIENLIDNSHLIKNDKLREKVELHKDQALMSKQLATIILDVPISFEEEKLKTERPDKERLKRLFDELEFRTLAQRVFTWLSTDPLAPAGNEKQPDLPLDLFSATPEESIRNLQSVEHSYHLTDTPEKREHLIRLLKTQKEICFDTETTGLDTSTAELVGMSFAVKPHEAWYVPVPENYAETLEIITEFKEIFEDDKITKIGQNLKFDISILKWYDVTVAGKLFDTMIAHYLLEPDLRHNMDFLAVKYLNYQPVPIEALIGKKGSSQQNMRFVDVETVRNYAAEDADTTLQLKSVFEPLLEKTGTKTLFEKIEIPLIPVLASMESEGVRIDPEVLKSFSGELEKEIRQLESNIFTHAGTTFNIASPRQLGEILFDKMKIVENPRQTKTKQYSTGEDILIKLVNKHPIISEILEYRSLTKLKSTYVDVLPGLINPRDGRIHTSYNQAVAATGRLSSNNPNLQNIPVRTEKGREIRKAFVPRNEKYTLLSADYSQIELRIIAHISKDQGMIADFRSGHDIHTATAAKVYNVPMEEVTKEMRRNAKTVNFGIIYGISAFGLSERLNIPRKEASAIILQYFEKYPDIRKYMDDTISFARENGFVETLMGRRRYLKDINSSNATIRGFAERNAINAPIQGTAADMIKIAMVEILNEINKRNLKSRMILQVHDELVFDVQVDETEEVKAIVTGKMQHAIELDVPVEIEISTGENWLEAH